MVIGYGTTGQAIARVLRETGMPFAAVDMNADNVKKGAAEKAPVRFGDATRRAVLEEMGAARARSAVVAVAEAEVHRVWLEGGPTLAGAFLAAGLVDEVVAYVAPVFLGRGRQAMTDIGITTMAEALRLHPFACRDPRLA